MVEQKDGGIRKEQYTELDELITSILGAENIITPDSVRGNFVSLHQSILSRKASGSSAWPTLENSQGKFILVASSFESGYTADEFSHLSGRNFFVASNPRFINIFLINFFLLILFFYF